MSVRTALTLFALLSASAFAQAQNVFATFSNNGGVVFNRTATSFSGGGTIHTFTLGSKLYANAVFTMTTLLVQGTTPSSTALGAELGKGSFVFKDNGGKTLLSATFDGARVKSNGFWNTAFNGTMGEGDNVLFGGLASGDQSGNGFSFALSPVIGVADSYNASFSAVGLVQVQAVPEPAGFAALSLGALAVLGRRRRGARP